MTPRWPSRRVVVALLVVVLLLPSAVSAVTYEPGEGAALRAGTVASPANGSTVISTQGYKFQGRVNNKKPARLVGVGPRGNTSWTYSSGRTEAWFYDVDPLPNGNLLVVSPRDGSTRVYELNPETRERVWERRLPFKDTHDVDMLNENELVISHMRAWDAGNRTSDDRIVVYNLTTNEVTWEWYYRNHFPADTDGGQSEDWTHSNDVDPLPGGRLLLSPRNFDQVLVVNRSTKNITRRLGADDEHSVLREQHNPDYLVSENGTPTVLVADSGNDRVVEYAHENGSWTRTWSVGGESLNWPRDADRLPNGNTLIVDTLNHRIVEVTPTGEVVWEYYATWGPYDAERVAYGDGSRGPTIRDMNAGGSYDITGSANLNVAGAAGGGFPDVVQRAFAGTPLSGAARSFAGFWGQYAPWVRPVWMESWDFVAAVFALLLLAGWAGTELGRLTIARYRRRNESALRQ